MENSRLSIKMLIKRLNLIQFRNYLNETIEFDPGLNLIMGENAQGKTNLIEAMFYLARGYSHRGSTAKEMAHFDVRDYKITAWITDSSVNHELSGKGIDGKKQFFLDGKIANRQKISQVLNVILFEPGDLKIVKEGPDQRRRFLNEEISAFKPQYYYLIKNYEKVLFQRNSLLKNIAFQPSLITTLDAWNEQLVKLGVQVIKQRLAYLHRLNKEAGELHYLLSNKKERLSLFYQNNIIDSLEEVDQLETRFFDKLKDNQDEEIKKGCTSFGPQLDDMIVHINQKDARRFGSQGQQRSAAIALKLSQIKIIHQQTSKYPVVLLDDIFSELDESRRQCILDLLEKSQTFITCTEDLVFKNNELEGSKKIIKIKAGKVQLR